MSITNEAGERTAVVVVYSDWEKLQRQQQQLRQKLQIMHEISGGLAEVKEARRTGQALPSLSTFLDDAD